MTEAEIQAIVQAVLGQCEAQGAPLDDLQQQILLRILTQSCLNGKTDGSLRPPVLEGDPNAPNPLAELSEEERQIFLQFVRNQIQQNQSWKLQLLNDWLQGKSSGKVQFIRDRLGMQWLDRVNPVHLSQYLDLEDEDGLQLAVGDVIEVSNGLWEWVQEEGPCQREWVPCRVVGIAQVRDDDRSYTTCTIRFENGTEYEIQGIYDWNRPNWRWARTLEGS